MGSKCCTCADEGTFQQSEPAMQTHKRAEEDDLKDSNLNALQVLQPPASKAGPSQTSSLLPGHVEFNVHVVKDAKNCLLGVDVDLSEGCVMLVETVSGGLIGDWNQNHSDCQVRPGDKIIEVNGHRGSVNDMLQACKDDTSLHMVVLRQEGERDGWK
mmetsp:Transcript_28666/g.66095  ORF Transcript_28666/g.66095 Transcript_28666/m.66095 type:complete len:157 (-) Transcript_28666:65-535(-)